MRYKHQYQADNIIRVADGAVIPNNPTLSAYAEYLEWAATNETLAATPPPQPTAEQIQNASDIAFAKTYAKLNTLSGMTPQALQTYITNNVVASPSMQDALYTLALAVGILWRDKK